MGRPQTLMIGDTVGFDSKRNGGRTFRIGIVSRIENGHAWIKLDESDDFQRMWRRPIEDLDDLKLYGVIKDDRYLLLTTNFSAAELLQKSIRNSRLKLIEDYDAIFVSRIAIFVGYRARVVIDRIESQL